MQDSTGKRMPTADSVRHESVWSATATMPIYSSLREDVHADVCIVGAGIAGLTTAYLLAQAGKTVAILDDGELAGGMTSATTAHLTNALDDRYFEMERLHGAAGARLAAESHTAAIDRIEAVIRKEQVQCDFERLNGYLILSPGQGEEILDRELAAAQRAGVPGVTKIERAPLEPFNTGPCLRFPNQAQFHPLKYLAGMAKAIQRDGGLIFTNSHADQVEGGTPAKIKVGKRLVTADSVVVATNAPINDLVAIHTKQAPYMSYVIGARVPRGAVSKGLYWDTLESYHYVRLYGISEGHELLIVGGEDHKSGQADDTVDRHGRLEAWARERFPQMEQLEFVWAGQVMETIDGLAFIGRNPLDHDNVFVATGDSGMGMTHGTIAGILLTDLILGRENRWTALYDPARKTLRAAGEFLGEAANMAAQFADWVKPGEVNSADEIALDSGALLRRGLKMVAAYRDGQGALHERSAVCNHLGCIVHWNAAEKTWDCPCHGSRFDKLGKVFNGPANRDLARLEGEDSDS
jgi:glycine/D-amino acid oxidase-like deaminating enzyme/nitrite reductase/ring-hydroxylating ferredoxin subunit